MGGYICSVNDVYVALKNPTRNITFSVQYKWLLRAFVWAFPEKKNEDEDSDSDDEISSEMKKAQKKQKKQLKAEKNKEEKLLKDEQKKERELKKQQKEEEKIEAEKLKPKPLTDEEADVILQKAYYDDDMKFGRDKLYKTLRIDNPTITRKQVDSWLKKQALYQIDKPAFKPKDFKNQTASEPNKIWNIDLVMIDDDKVVLNCVDRFSRKAYSRILRNKTAIQVTKELDNIFKTAKPDAVVSDNGPEFKAVTTQKFLQSNDVKQFFSSPHLPQSNGIVEAFNKTLKEQFKKLSYQKSDDIANLTQPILKRLIKAYNDSVHSSINMTPNEAMEPENLQAVKTANEKKTAVVQQQDDISRGDRVRVVTSKGNDKTTQSHRTNFSEELFFVKSVKRPQNKINPIEYKIMDKDEVPLKGLYKREEIQKVAYVENEDKVDIPYEVNKFLKMSGDEIQVSFKGQRQSENVWIDKKELKKDLGVTVFNKLFKEAGF